MSRPGSRRRRNSSIGRYRRRFYSEERRGRKSERTRSLHLTNAGETRWLHRGVYPALPRVDDTGVAWSRPHIILHDKIQTFRESLSFATYLMYLVQGLSTNLPNRDVEKYQSITHLFGLPLAESEPYGPLVPKCMKPRTYGFGFTARVQP
ncbi:hypothetical protein B0H66DRAFT_628823 [Apodospora peruviana]|uniref:Uncharacterized protein n=1 Tax=Apodospora peruviana TaxID=516989 RepID=A0AAE0HZZ3_9PEZI|nr:hypothetical protein B0H66DRAFT_628823 [Apodospora peruviana]